VVVDIIIRVKNILWIIRCYYFYTISYLEDEY
jgi:hypothetical protein